jgi:lysophospholipase L1-like esterase
VIPAENGALVFGWPGVYFEGRFRGDGLRIRLDTGDEILRLLIDGKEKARFAHSGVVDRTLNGLDSGEHVARLEKVTESQSGGSRLWGFYPIAGDSAVKPRARRRQIEFIGDSYTAGYGNTSPTRQCSGREVHDRTDTQQSFGPLVARRLDADYRIIAYSGRGIVRNYDGVVPGESMVALYPRAKPDDAVHAELPDPAWKPQVIVINLGTNDFSTKLHAGEKWPDDAALRADYHRSYVDFVRRLHASQPQARFVLMGSDLFFRDVEKVAAEVNEGSAGLVQTLEFGGLELTACDWHPSLADDRKLADMLIPAVENVAGWK